MSARANQLLEAGLWLKMSGDLEGARRLFEQALRLDPDSIRAQELLGHSMPDSEAVPQELRDVPVTRTDLFSVPLPRLFPEEEPPAPAGMPEEWWTAAPAEPGHTARFAVRTAEPIPPVGAVTSPTVPWGPSPLSAVARADRGAPAPAPVLVPPPPESRAPADPAAIPLPGRVAHTPAPRPAPASGQTPSPPPGVPEITSAVPGAGASRTTGAIPLPPVGASAGPAAGAVIPLPAGRTPVPPGPEEPAPWPMPLTPAPALNPDFAPAPVQPRSIPVGPPEGSPPGGAVPLPSRRSGPIPAVAPAVTPARPPGTASLPHDAWGEAEGPTLLAPEGAGDALELIAEPRTVSGLTPLPAPKDPRTEAVRLMERARELQNLDDHSGARELLLQAQNLFPELTGLADALVRSETKLQTIYESKIGKLSAVPRVRLKEDEVIWLNLDHRAGFMLAQIDGTLSFEDLFSVSGMSRLDTARILVQLLDQRVIIS